MHPEGEREREKKHTRGHAWAPACIPAPPSAAAPNPWSSWYPPISRPSPSRLPILLYTTTITEGVFTLRSGSTSCGSKSTHPLKCVLLLDSRLVLSLKIGVSNSEEYNFEWRSPRFWCHISATAIFHTWEPDPDVRSLVQILTLDQKDHSTLDFFGFGP